MKETPWHFRYLLPRLFITNLAVTQLLQPYPVAGTQLYIAATPVVLWGCILVFDGFPALVSVTFRFLPWLTPPKRLQPALLSLAAVMIGLALTAGALLAGMRFTSRYPSLNLPGASLLRMEPRQAARYRWLSATMRQANCDNLFSLPSAWKLQFLVRRPVAE